MKKTLFAIAAIAFLAPAIAPAQEGKPGVAVTSSVDAVVEVKAIDREARVVTLQGPKGNVVDMKVPPEAQNLDKVQVGSKFRVRYLESVAVFISPVGGEPASGETSAMELAEKGATPGGIIVNVKQAQARVESIDYNTRAVVLIDSEGKSIALTVDAAVKRLNEVKVGDLVVVRFTEALAMKMIEE